MDDSQNQAALTISFMEGDRRICPEQILYVESRLHKTYYHIWDARGEERVYSRYEKLNDAQKLLEPHGFCRTHQSYLVNMEKALHVKRYEISMAHDVCVNISKRYYKDTKQSFLQMKQRRRQ